MKNLRISFSIIILCALAGCATQPPTTYSAGITGPKLATPLAADQKIWVLSSLTDIKVNIIRENIFTYQPIGATTIASSLVNGELSTNTASTLKSMNFQSVHSIAINGKNVLNTTDIQWGPYQLTASAKRFLSKQTHSHDSDILILITQNGPQALTFDLKCELSKRHTYYQASIEPHLYLYKIYIIDAHTLKILTWSTGSANGSLPDTHLCKPLAYYKGRDYQDLQELLINDLSNAVTADLSRVLVNAPT